MGSFVIGLREVDGTRAAEVGAKGATLGELTRVVDVRVPDGFCVTTEAFRRAAGRAVVPDDVATAIRASLATLGGDTVACAVRSSATAEDSPTASFAGQYDSFPGVVGAAAVIDAVRRCWASLHTERAVAYRRRSGTDAPDLAMGVVVQRMVDARAAGVLFTADPLTGDRRVVRIEAVAGLAEDLVAGRAPAEAWSVRDGRVEPPTAAHPLLTEAQAARLARIGQRIAAHFGHPQDVEWCLEGDDVWIVQARPVTTLFPIPAAAADGQPHVYVSVGHNQMMTDPMAPLGLSVFRLTAIPPMHEAGGRLWVDVTARLRSPATRSGLLDLLGRGDPLVRDALETVLERRGDLAATPPDVAPAGPPPGGAAASPPEPIPTDPAVVAELVAATRASIATLERDIREVSGPALFDLIRRDITELKRLLTDARSMQAIMAGMEATWWLDDHLAEWLGEPNAADALARSAPGNVTAQMGLALLDVADAIRPHRDVIAFLERVRDPAFLDDLDAIPGGREAQDAIRAWLAVYGMRCIGEIDITRPRWSERPDLLVPVILGNVRNFAPGAGARRFAQGRRHALRAEHELLARVRALPDGDAKAAETARMIARLRTFIGYREFPKYGIVSRYLVYKRALRPEIDRLVQAGVLSDARDADFLTLDELEHAVRTGEADGRVIAERRAALRWYATLTPPRVLTSDGEALTGAFRRDDVPAGALPGLAVSAGVVEGRARVVADMGAADLEPGDILVTTHTDPSWTPVFVTVAGLVTEVGGLMTHGAVIAREYGLPAVVGVADATRRIHDGQRIRVDGARGYVEVREEG